METAIVSLIIITVALFGMLTISYSHLSSQDAVLMSWREMEIRLGERARTDLSPVSAVTDGNSVEFTVENEGDVRLADFDEWDVILEYDSIGDQEHVEWCRYAPGQGCYWTQQISEVFEPGILNPGEEMLIAIWPTAEVTPTGQAIVVTPNGTGTSRSFTR